MHWCVTSAAFLLFFCVFFRQFCFSLAVVLHHASCIAVATVIIVDGLSS
jgi:hypothetical protein